MQYIKKACMAEYELTEAQNDAIREKTQELVGVCVRGFYKKISNLNTEEDFKLENKVRDCDMPTHTMYKLINEDGQTSLPGKGGIRYEFLVETDCEDFAYGIYYGCRCILNTEGDVVEQVNQCNDEWRYLQPQILSALNNTFVDLDFSNRTIPTDNVSRMTYWPFWIRLGENEDVNGVAAVATRVIRNVYREFFREENYAKYQSNVAVELGRKRGPKVVAKIETRYTQAAYDLVVKELSNKRHYVGNARELLEKFITILIRNGVIRHYPIYEKCWIVVDWSNCEIAELIARFSKIISAKEDKRVKWSLFNTILISKHNGPFDDIRKQYSWGNGLKDSRQVDIENIMKELLS